LNLGRLFLEEVVHMWSRVSALGALAMVGFAATGCAWMLGGGVDPNAPKDTPPSTEWGQLIQSADKCAHGHHSCPVTIPLESKGIDGFPMRTREALRAIIAQRYPVGSSAASVRMLLDDSACNEAKSETASTVSCAGRAVTGWDYYGASHREVADLRISIAIDKERAGDRKVSVAAWNWHN
jgi:hypothetical protein